MGMLIPVRRTGGRSAGAVSPRRLMRRIARWIGADGNPLRRRVDKVEIWMRILLVLAFLVVAPLITPLVGHNTEASDTRMARQDASWTQVQAIVRRPAPQQFYGYGSLTTYWVRATWTAPSGAPRHGLVPVRAGTTSGTRVAVWVNGRGQVTGRPPMTAGTVRFRTILSEYVTAAGLALVVLGLIGLLRLLLNRRRMTTWGLEWACFGPRWSTRRWPRSSGN
jgi:multisubunit Na+/H+ antiporter MnhG subunit